MSRNPPKAHLRKHIHGISEFPSKSKGSRNIYTLTLTHHRLMPLEDHVPSTTRLPCSLFLCHQSQPLDKEAILETSIWSGMVEEGIWNSYHHSYKWTPREVCVRQSKCLLQAVGDGEWRKVRGRGLQKGNLTEHSLFIL